MQFILSIFAALMAAAAAKVPTFVMMPLTTVSTVNGKTQLTNRQWVQEKFSGLSSIGMHGIMSDCWWGLVEKNGPKQYDFTAYQDMAAIAQENNIKIQMVLSFHACGGNVGDDCNIPIPQWLENPAYYQTRAGTYTKEYISLFADRVPMDSLGRTPLDMYRDFMQAFKTQVMDMYPGTVEEVQVGAGPSGELRYPSYQLEGGRWSYCGVGEFQSYDEYALESVKNASIAQGVPMYGLGGGPSNAGTFNCKPYGNGNSNDCPFYSGGFDSFNTDYGRFFLSWYSNSLLKHGDDLTDIARQVYGSELALSMKIAGIHWGYASNNHGAELTAGYYNADGVDGYALVADMLAKRDIIFCFTCLEMTHEDNVCASRPKNLVGQTQDAVRNAQGQGSAEDKLKKLYAGENALPIHGYDALNQVVAWSKGTRSFTLLRLSDSTNWEHLRYLVDMLK